MTTAIRTSLLLFLIATAITAQPPYDLLLKGGRVIDPKNKIDAISDVAVARGRIARVAPNIPASQAKQVVNVGGLIVAPGLIDIHVHVYQRPENPAIKSDSDVQADAHSFRSGVTTMVDAGTSGASNFADFKARVIDKSQTRVLALLNIAASGMGTGHEDDLPGLDAALAARTAKAHPGLIVGFKSAHFGGPGWESIDAAVKASKITSLPVMVDFGYLNKVRNLGTLLEDKLRAGDIYTHCYSGHRRELTEDGKVNPAMINGRKRGIWFDVGHGAGSFYWYVAVPSFQQGFLPDIISTDLHTGSMNAGMKDMTNVMSKVLNLGSIMPQVIAMSTWNAAKSIKRSDLGHLDAGAEADIAVLRVDKGQFGFIDSAGAGNTGANNIVAELTLRKGKVVWDLNARAAQNWKSFPYKKESWKK